MYKLVGSVLLALLISGCSQSETSDTADIDTDVAESPSLNEVEHSVDIDSSVVESDTIADENLQANDETSVADGIINNEHTLGVTPTEFAKRYHSIFEEAGDDADWYRLDLEDTNTQGDFTHNFEGSLSVLGKVNDEGVLESLEYNWNPDEQELQNETLVNNLIFITTISAVALTPDVDENEVAYEIGDLLTEVSEKDVANPDGVQHGERQIGNNTYIMDIVDDELTYLIIPTSVSSAQ